MNVYDSIAANNRKTAGILCAFPAALFVTVYAFALLIAAGDDAENVLEYALRMTLASYPLLVLAVAVWVVVSFYSGDKMILGTAHARRVAFEENRDLFRLVENTAIMAGLPVPEIYLVEDDSLNAFATGRNPKNASIALTKGLAEKLDKAELQAVIAHELAHIGNRDSRLMLIVVAGIGCFLFFGEILFRVAIRSLGGRGKGKAKAAAVLFLMGVMCLVFGYVLAPILRFALSRRREYQADATAVKITRDPDALARALAKIAHDPKAKTLAASALVGNLCIADPVGYRRLFCTHPPIRDRIAALGVDVSGLVIPDGIPEISDITKGRVKVVWAIGALGTLGFHYFAVSRIFMGLIRLVYGLFVWGLVMVHISIMQSMPVDSGSLSAMAFYLMLLFAPSIYDMARIRRGTFRDGKGSFIKL